MKLVRFYIFLCLSAGMIVFGCSSTRHLSLSEEKPVLSRIQMEKMADLPEQTDPGGDSLRLDVAIKLALENNPELEANRIEIEMARVRANRENRLPNPEIEAEMENFAGSGPYNAYGAGESTLAIGQLIELSGKRNKRTLVADMDFELAAWTYEIKRLALITAIRNAYVNAVAFREKRDLYQERLALSEEFREKVDMMVKSGLLSTAEKSRADVEFYNTQVAARKIEAGYREAMYDLTALLGGKGDGFDRVAGTLVYQNLTLDKKPDPQKYSEIPQVRLETIRMRKQAAAVELARALQVPDPTVKLGYRHFNGTNDQALVAGLSIPIPLFNQGGEGVSEADYRLRQSEKYAEASRLQMKTAFQKGVNALTAIQDELTLLSTKIIPGARHTNQIIIENYQRGNYRFLEVLDARRQLFNAREQYLDAVARAIIETNQIEGLFGQPIASILEEIENE